MLRRLEFSSGLVDRCVADLVNGVVLGKVAEIENGWLLVVIFVFRRLIGFNVLEETYVLLVKAEDDVVRDDAYAELDFRVGREIDTRKSTPKAKLPSFDEEIVEGIRVRKILKFINEKKMGSVGFWLPIAPEYLLPHFGNEEGRIVNCYSGSPSNIHEHNFSFVHAIGNIN